MGCSGEGAQGGPLAWACGGGGQGAEGRGRGGELGTYKPGFDKHLGTGRWALARQADSRVGMQPATALRQQGIVPPGPSSRGLPPGQPEQYLAPGHTQSLPMSPGAGGLHGVRGGGQGLC